MASGIVAPIALGATSLYTESFCVDKQSEVKYLQSKPTILVIDLREIHI
jgi:hypothetical protein